MVALNIIIEGCDRLGKTTLVNNLCKFIDFTVHHYGPPPKHEKVDNYDYQQTLYAASIEYLNMHNNIILDRFILGEAVYSPIYRGYYPWYIRHFEDRLFAKNILIVLDGSYELVKQRYDGIFIKLEHVEQLLCNYRYEFEQSHVKNKILINVENKSQEDVLIEVIRFIKSRFPSNIDFCKMLQIVACFN